MKDTAITHNRELVNISELEKMF